LWRGLLGFVLVGFVVAHAAGGWYVSSRIRVSALEVQPPDRTPDVSVEGVAGDRVTISALEGEPVLMSMPGVVGLAYRGGYAQMGEIQSETGGAVTRTFELIEGSPPVVGLEADLQAAAFPGPEAAGLDVNEIEYTTPLGPMDAWLVSGGSTWVIHVHGKGGTPNEATRLMRALDREGITQLSITYRNDEGQPPDPSGAYRYGTTEYEDLAGAIEYAVEEGADRVYVAGYSTGGAIAVAQAMRDERLSGLILDAPNLDMGETIAFGAAREPLPLGLPMPRSIVSTGIVFSSLRDDFDWEQTDYVQRAGRIIVPVLVFHGTADDWVPIETSRRFAEARSEQVSLIEVEGAAHVASWNVDPEAYETAVLDFLATAG
jgi:hypothetical protein